jgi:hypothetical protein
MFVVYNQGCSMLGPGVDHHQGLVIMVGQAQALGEFDSLAVLLLSLRLCPVIGAHDPRRPLRKHSKRFATEHVNTTVHQAVISAISGEL